MKPGNYIITILASAGLIFTACDNSLMPVETDNFDRREMLTFWADNIIIPAMEAYDMELQALVQSKNDFIEDPTIETLELLRHHWLQSYKAWQHVSMFDIGKAEATGYRNYINIYPADPAQIRQNVAEKSINLDLPSNFTAQGFPALDYLLFGTGGSDNEVLSVLTESGYTDYLEDLVDKLSNRHEIVLEDWHNGFRDLFINNDGASATASTDKMVNDFLYYYEKYFRAGKVGIPAGVFSGNVLTGNVEAYYSSQYSRILFSEALDAIEDFFTGRSFDGSLGGPSLMQYIQHVSMTNGTRDVSEDILLQWDKARARVEALDNDFVQQLEEDPAALLGIYDDLQTATVLLKVDMMQALNIQVDYVDADGD